MTTPRKIAYFSMEIGLENSIPTYSGGLGVLAGDTLKSAADMGLPMVGVTLLYSNGYFNQIIENGMQLENYTRWDPGRIMTEVPERVSVRIQDRDVVARAWRYDVKGRKGNVPVYFLDTGVGNNAPFDGDITARLYDDRHSYNKITQRAILGIGGLRLLEKLGHDIDVYHMNESHAALLALELMKKTGNIDKVREKCVFTTHSPVAGHDNFDYGLANDVIPGLPPNVMDIAGRDLLNMTNIALNASRNVNAVSKKHAETASKQYGRDIIAITNGVHPYTWTSPEMQIVFDEDVPEWRKNPSLLADVSKVDSSKLTKAHKGAKAVMIDHLKEKTGVEFDADTPVIGYARRLVEYKRPWLLFSDMERLKGIMKGKGQVVFGGKAHPNYREMKETIAYINSRLGELRRSGINAAYLPNYGMEDCARLTAGCDLWLNNPRIPNEASGTSGMCAAHNGVPQLSTLDGWWPEGHEEGRTGWKIGDNFSSDERDAEDLYSKLEVILPQISNGQAPGIMRDTISRNASRFNTERMAREYVEKVYKINV